MCRFRLSSRLAELTQNTTYLDAAKLSIQFAQTHLLNPGNSAALINDTWSVSHCASSGTPATWDLGPFIVAEDKIVKNPDVQLYNRYSKYLKKSASMMPRTHGSEFMLCIGYVLTYGTPGIVSLFALSYARLQYLQNARLPGQP